jgi:hypothetical protein
MRLPLCGGVGKLALAILVLLPFTMLLDAATLTVDCRYPAPPGRFQRVLAKLNPLGPNTIHVFGSCRENVVVRGFDRLIFAAHQGGTIQDASEGQQPVVEIVDSRRVEFRGFRIVGGSSGVVCRDGSLCRFSANTFERAAGYGVWMASSQASFSGDTIQEAGNAGLSFDATTVDVSSVTVQRNEHGIFVSNASVLTATGLMVSENRGDGIGVDTQAHLILSNSMVSANGAVGVNLNNQSQALLGSNSITGNGVFGVGLGDLSQAYFGGDTITGNQDADVNCYGKFSVATNLEGSTVGATNCRE